MSFVAGLWGAVKDRAALGTLSSRQSNFRNALYGAGEYVVLPLTMLAAAPFLLRHLGPSQYGLWMLAAAAVTSSSFISTGFGDAALKYAATYRGNNDRKRLEDTLRVNLTINLALAGMLAALIWYGSPWAVHALLKIEPALQAAGVTTFRVGSIILLVKSAESVFIGALRAHERYGPAVQISILSRIGIVLCACILVAKGYGVVAIMLGTFSVITMSAVMQANAARAVMGRMFIWPSVNRVALREVLNFGCFSWLQALSGCIFNYADRLLIGVLLGTSSVAYYSVCVQAAQPIHGLIAAGLHFLFPHLSARLEGTSSIDLGNVVRPILWVNIVAAAMLCIPLAVFSKPILRLWLGGTFAEHAWAVLSIIAVGFGFLALNITGHYSLLALGHVRLVALLNLAGGVAMLIAMATLAPRFGLPGAAMGRLLYGPITLLMYLRLHSILVSGSKLHPNLAVPLTS